jgi:hypothetical protein
MRWTLATLALALVALSADTAEAQRRAKPVQPTPYDQGKVSLSLGGGFNGTNGQIGGGLGYFVIKGLEVGVEGFVTIQSDTTIGVLGPQARYIVWQVPTIHPYIGPFYRHWFIGDEIEDRDSVGARAGIITAQKPFYLSAGVAYERFLGCTDDNCAFVTPEINLGISF